MKHIKLLLVFIIIPVLSFATVARDAEIDLKHQAMQIVNYILVIVSLISIRQFFWPGENNRTLFQIFNMVFTVVYYLVSITFIISHQTYFVGFEDLSYMGCVRKFFFDYDVSMVLHIIVLFSFLINILYIIRFGRRYYLDII